MLEEKLEVEGFTVGGTGDEGQAGLARGASEEGGRMEEEEEERDMRERETEEWLGETEMGVAGEGRVD